MGRRARGGDASGAASRPTHRLAGSTPRALQCRLENVRPRTPGGAERFAAPANFLATSKKSRPKPSPAGRTRAESSDELSEPDWWLSGAVYRRRIGVRVLQSADRLSGPPEAPNTEKLEVYECGEPTISSSFVQFDLRFYVIALLFIIFDVEVAFFFPWATVYGKAVHLLDPRVAAVAASEPGMAASHPLTRTDGGARRLPPTKI